MWFTLVVYRLVYAPEYGRWIIRREGSRTENYILEKNRGSGIDTGINATYYSGKRNEILENILHRSTV